MCNHTLKVDILLFMNISITYAILSGDINSKFSLTATDPPDLQVAAAVEPDEPTTDDVSYTLVISASDGLHDSVMTVLVTMDNFDNDNAPIFVQTAIAVSVSCILLLFIQDVF